MILTDLQKAFDRFDHIKRCDYIKQVYKRHINVVVTKLINLFVYTTQALILDLGSYLSRGDKINFFHQKRDKRIRGGGNKDPLNIEGSRWKHHLCHIIGPN